MIGNVSGETALLKVGELINERWKVIGQIGEGTYSQIYCAKDIKNDTRVAVKVEAKGPLKPVLEMESRILQTLQKSTCVCRYFYHGIHNSMMVLVMELLGESMSGVRGSGDAQHGVPLARAKQLSFDMLQAIQSFHDAGFVHRDIKASNFVLSPTKKKYLIIDFGLAKHHIDEDGNVMKPRNHAEFRGTSLYASLAAHRCQELGRKDDIWSFFYLLLDFLRSELPWMHDAHAKNRPMVEKVKEYYTESNPQELLQGVPGGESLLNLMDYLRTLRYEDRPDYDKIRHILRSMSSKSSTSIEESSLSAEVDIFLQNTKSRSFMEVASTWIKIYVEKISNCPTVPLETLISMIKAAPKFDTGSNIKEYLSASAEFIKLNKAIYDLERRITIMENDLPLPVKSFSQKRKADDDFRRSNLVKRRNRDSNLRRAISSQISKE